MSTSAVDTGSALAVTTEVKTFYRVVYKNGQNEDGTDKVEYKIVNEKVGEEVAKTGIFDKKEVISCESQSFTEYFANSDAGETELIPDEGERNAMFNRGVSTKQDNKARQLLSAVDENGDWSFAVTATSYDMREDLKVPTNRRLSPFEKLTNELTTTALTPQMLEAFEKLLAARKAELAG